MKIITAVAILVAAANSLFAQPKIKVPTSVNSSLSSKYPEAKQVTWEKENGNYEANWGGKTGEDNSVQFTPAGSFIEIVKAMPVSSLPANTLAYVKTHFKTSPSEAGKVTNAQGKTFYEADVKGKDVLFDERGNFVKKEK